ncbi:MAG: hypothetical protein Sapg2KO_52400 [Saprospiraceae bacterium]
MELKAFRYSLRLDIDVIYPPQERSDKLEIPIEKELGDNGRILLSVPKYRRGENGEFIYDPVSLNIVVNDLIKGIQQIESILSGLNLLTKSQLQFDTEIYNLLELGRSRNLDLPS